MTWRAYQLCDHPPARRLEIIAKEFPYIRFNSTGIEANKKKELTAMLLSQSPTNSNCSS